MKIYHLTTSLVGGAGIAAQRLHSAFLGLGLNSQVISVGSAELTKGYVAVTSGLMVKIRSKLLTVLNQSINKHVFFSTYTLDRVKTHILPNSPIVFIHNWYNLIDLKKLPTHFPNPKTKIFLVLHDERSFTGGCHYAMDCQQFLTGCRRCPKSRFLHRAKIRDNSSKVRSSLESLGESLTVIAPSNWIAKRATESFIMARLRVIPIMNVHKIDVDISCKQFDSAKIVIGNASMNPNNFLKGDFSHLNQTKSDDIEITRLCDVNNSESSKEAWWLSIDYLLVPSISDNSPNVIHEAKLRGIPVIATRVGGIPEILNEGFDIFIDSHHIGFEELRVAIDIHRLSFDFSLEARSAEARNYRQNSELALVNYLDCLKD